MEASRRALQKGGFGAVLLVDIVDIIPDVYKAAAVQRPEKVDQRRRPQADDHRFVEQVKFYPCHPQYQQHTGEQRQIAPQAHQRKKELTAGRSQRKNSQQHRRCSQCQHTLCRSGNAGLCNGFGHGTRFLLAKFHILQYNNSLRHCPAPRRRKMQNVPPLLKQTGHFYTNITYRKLLRRLLQPLPPCAFAPAPCWRSGGRRPGSGLPG